MFKQKLKTPSSVKRASLLAMLVIVMVASFVAAFSRPDKAEAATNSTINFQARLLTAAGKVVPDGTYNVEFKLYDVASSGTALWTETRTSTDRVRTVNGYLTVNLGSVNGFGTSINWDQELWLTMNIGGTAGSPTWDGEMTPRLKLTSVPYAFRAGQLVGGSGANTTTLDTGTPSGNNVIHLPAESGTLCVQNSTNCGFATSAGSGNYIQNGTSLQTANFYIQSAANNSVGGIIRGASGQTSSLFQLLDGSSGLTVAQFTNNGYLHLGSDSIARTGQIIFHDGTLSNTFVATLIAPTALSANRTITLPNETGTLCIQSSTSCGFAAGAGDADYIQNQSAGAQATADFWISGVGRADTALEAPILRTNNGSANRHVIDGSTNGNVTFNANGASTDFTIQGDTDVSLFVADGSADRIGIGINTPAYKLDVNGDINVASGSVYRIGGSPICTVSGCVSAPASGSYIQNGTTVQTNANFTIRSSAIGSVTGVVQGANGQTADIFQAQTWNGTTATTVLAVAANGTVTASAGLAATGTVNINASSNNNTNINTGTSTGTVTIGGGSAPLAIDSTNFDVTTAGAVSGVTTLTTSGAINGQTISSAANFTGTLAIQGNTTIGDSVANDTLTVSATLQGSTPLVFEGTTADANETTFAIVDPTTDRTVTFGDEGGTVCLQSSANCGFALSSGSGSYIQNGTTVQVANYAIRSNAIGNVSAVIQGANGQTADMLRVQTWNGTTATSVVTVSNVGLLTASAGVSVTNGLTATGTVAINSSVNSNTSINIGTSTGTVTIGGGSAPLVIDSTNFDVTSAGAVSGVTTLTTSGAINGQTISSAANFTGTLAIQGNTTIGDSVANDTLTVSATLQGSTPLVFEGTTADGNETTFAIVDPTTDRTITFGDEGGTVCLQSSANCGFALSSGSGNYIQNGTTIQVANYAIRSNAIGDVSAVIQGANGQTADILRVQTWNGTTATSVVTVNNAGLLTASAGINVTNGVTATGTVSINASSNNNTSINTGTSTGTITLGGGSSPLVIDSTNFDVTSAGAVSGATTITGSGNFNSTGGAIQTNSTNRIDNTGNLVNIGNITGTGAITIASSGATNDVIINGADQFIVQDASQFNAQANFDLSANDEVYITGTGTSTNTRDYLIVDMVNNTTSGTQRGLLIQNAAGTGATEGFIALDNTDTDTAVGYGLQITSSVAGITTALDVSDADIVTALSFGANDLVGTTGNIDMTNFDVTGSTGAVTAGTYNGQTISATANFTGTLAIQGNTTIGDSVANDTLTVSATLQGSSPLVFEGTTADANETTFTFTDPTTDRTVTFGDEGGTVCLQSSANCGFALSSGSGNYIQNGTTVQTANYAIRSSAIGNVGAVIQGANGQTADLFRIQTWNGTTATSVVTVSNVGLLTASAGISVTNGLTATGTVAINSSVNSNTSINIGTSTGTVTIGGGTAPLVIDSTNFDVTSAGAVSGVTTLTTSGAINGQTISSTANFTGTVTIQGSTALTLGTSSSATGSIVLRGSGGTGTLTVAGPTTPNAGNFTVTIPAVTANANFCTDNTVCTGYAPATGSGNYIQNTTTVQAANFAIRSSAIGNVGAVIQGANGQTADILRVQTWNGTTATTVFGVGNTGNITATGTYNSNTFTSSALTFGAAATATISSAASQALDITSNAAATWSTSTGNLSIQAQGNLNLGNAGGQNINIGTDNKAHTITIGNQSTTGAQSIIIGSNGNTGNSVSFESGATGTINIGNAASAHSINMGTGAAVQAIAIGSTNGTSSLALSSGTGDLSLTSTDLLIAKATTSFQVQNSSNAALLYVDTANGRVGVGGQATFSKFEVIGGDAAVYNNGNNPRLVLGDSTSGGQNGYLQWDSTNDYFRIESVGTNGLKINDNFIAIGNMFPDQPLKVANGSTLLFQVNTTGSVLSKTSTNSATGFQIQDSSNNGVFTVDTSAAEIEFGKASTTNGKLVFYNSSNANVVNIQSGVTSSAYTLTLPTALGNAGDCLKDAGSGALQFTACGNLSGSLQGAYTSSIGSTTPEIIVDSSRGGVDIQDVSTPGSSLGTSPLFAVRGQATASTLGAKYFSIQGDGRVAIGNITATNALDVAGSINVTTGNTYKINGTDICSAAGCTAASGSGFYIQNGTSQQTANFNIVSNAAGSTAAQIQNAASSTVPVLIVKGGATPGANADLIQLQDSSAAVHLKVDNDGDAAISKSLKVGTTASMATSTLDVAGNAAFTVNNTTTNAQTVKIEQTGTGDSAIELKNTSLSYYMGIDTSAGTFKLSSSQASGSTINMGYTAVGGTTDSADRNTMNATKFTASATGTVSALNVYVASPVSGNPNDKAQVGIYSDNSGVPNTRLGFSNDATVAGNSWNTVNLTSGVSVTSGTVYWLVYNTNGSTNSNNNMVYDSGAANQTRWVSQTYGTWPTTWSGGSFSSVQFSIYAPIAVSSATDNLGAGLMEIGGTGATKFKNSTNSTSAFQVQNAAGTAFFNADSTNQRIGIGTNTPSYKLDVVGDVNISTGSAYKINGSNICVAAGCTAASGSGFYIQNGTSQQTANFNIISGSSGSTAAQIQGAANGTQTILVVKGSSTPGANADLIQLQDSSANVLMKVDNDGDMTVARSVNIAYVSGVDSFQIQGASNPFVTVNPTTNKFYIGDVSSACGGRFCVNQPVTGTGGSTYTNMFNNMPVAVTTASNFIGQDITITDTSGNAVANTTRGIRIDMSGSTAQGASYNGMFIKTPTTTSNSVFAGNIIQLQNGSTNLFRVTNTGNVDFQNTLNSVNALTVLNAAGTAVMNVDTTNSRVGIGTGITAPNEKLQVAGGINLGNSVLNNSGTIRWSGSDFEGYNGSSWISLTNSVLTTTPIVSKVKTANETLASNATFQNDDDLFFNIGANETWTFKYVVQMTSGATPDFKLQLTAPSGATCTYSIESPDSQAVTANTGCSVSSGNLAQTGIDRVFILSGSVTNGATPGSVNLQWAQNTSTASNTTVYAGSTLDAVRSVGGSGTAQAFIQGGNSFGAAAVLGTNDGQALNVRTNGTTRMTISSAGNTTLSNGTTGVSLQINHNNSTGNILNLNNNSSNIFTVNANGDLMIDGIADSATAFQIVDGSGTDLLTFNTANGSLKINGTGTNLSGGRLFFGDQSWVYVGEYSTTDTDTLAVYGEDGIHFGTLSGVDTMTLIDDALLLNGDARITGTMAIGANAATEALSVTGNFNVRNSGTLTKQYRFRTTGSALDFEAGGAGLYLSTWTGVGFTGTQEQHIILNTNGTMQFPSVGNTGTGYFSLCIQQAATGEVRRGSSVTSCANSSARYKKNIQSMTDSMGLEAIMALRPVTFNYKEGDPRNKIGFIAEEVNNVLPDLVAYDDQGRPNAVDYEFMVANLVKGIQQQQSQINQMRIDIDSLRQGLWNGGLVSGETTFSNLVTFNSGVKFTSDATFEGNVAFKKKVTYSEDAAGTVTIPQGETEFEVKFKAPYASVPRIALSADQFVTLKVSDKTVDGFKVKLRVPYTEDVIVDWVATQTEVIASNP